MQNVNADTLMTTLHDSGETNYLCEGSVLPSPYCAVESSLGFRMFETRL